MKNKLQCLLKCIYHFSKYAWTILIRNKGSIIVRNAIAQVFIQGYLEIILSDNEKEFINKILNVYLEEIEVKHYYGSQYHAQSQGVIEAFNRTVQSYLSVAYDNAKDEKIDWDLKMNLLHFLHFYNCKSKHTITGQISKRVFDNFNNEKVRKKAITTFI